MSIGSLRGFSFFSFICFLFGLNSLGANDCCWCLEKDQQGEAESESSAAKEKRVRRYKHCTAPGCGVRLNQRWKEHSEDVHNGKYDFEPC